VASTIVTSSLDARGFSAISSPMNPAPITTAAAGAMPTSEARRAASSTVRSVRTRSYPGWAGAQGQRPC